MSLVKRVIMNSSMQDYNENLGVYPTAKGVVLSIGRVVGAFGVKGWLKVKTTSPNLLLNNKSVLLNKNPSADVWMEVAVTDAAMHGDTVNFKLPAVNDRDAALLYRGYLVGIYRDTLPKLNDDEIYWVDLLGITVLNKDGNTIGIVNNFIEAGSSTVMVIKTNTADVLIPFVDTYVLTTDLNARVITVDWDYFD